ncbi:hypothetical protein BpHYR1_048570 [Brachionus plicatilis]|uniref:Uncharacterized protein n=1 Tax=Brachionus plicatilis TaxID=10195 RepID=A0A3M7PXA6_BRAPC|nr:hypothetical protein BpHYR1_048570 [Brachionus plicatilis]
MHQEAFNKLNLLTVSSRLFELSERYIKAGLSHSVPLVLRLRKNKFFQKQLLDMSCQNNRIISV